MKFNSSFFNKKIILFFFFILFSLIFVETFHIFNKKLPSRHGDDAVYLNSAFNLSKYGTFSSQIEEYRVNNHKNVIKPPLYSFFLSIFIDKNKKINNVNLECIYQKNVPKNCIDFIQQVKKVNLYIHYFHSILIYVLILIFTKNNILSFVGCALILSSTYFLSYTNISSTLFLLHSFGFYMMFYSKKKKLIFTVIASLSLGFLILTKAIFLYWFKFLLVFFFIYILVRIIFNKFKININYFFCLLNLEKIILFFLLILLLITPWQLRNFLDKGQFKISLQGGNAIAERVEYLRTEISDIKYGILFYTPLKKIKKIYIDKINQTSFMFDENSFNSHYANSDDMEKGLVLSKLKWVKKNNPDEIFSKSIEIILDNPIKHSYLTLMFFIRGVFVNTQNDQYPKFLQILSSFSHWSSILLMPIIFIYTLIARDNKIFLILPSMFVITSYSLFTDFEPRYGTIVMSTYVLIIMSYINIILKKIYEKRK